MPLVVLDWRHDATIGTRKMATDYRAAPKPCTKFECVELLKARRAVWVNEAKKYEGHSDRASHIAVNRLESKILEIDEILALIE